MPGHLTILLSLPAAAALAIGVLGRGRARLSRALALASAALTTIAALPLWFAYRPRGDEWQLVEHVPLLPSIGASYSLGLDGFSVVLILVTAVAGVVVIASLGSIADRTWPRLLVLQCALLGVFLSLDLLLWLLFTIAALVSTAAIARDVGSASRSGAWVWLSTCASGALLAAAVLVLYFSFHALSGAYTFDLRVLQHAAIPRAAATWAFAALFFGFLVAVVALLAGRFISSDLEAPATHVSSICAATVLQIAAYSSLRISHPVLPDVARGFGPAVMTLAVASTVVCAFVMFAQREWQRRAAYAIVCQCAAAIAGAFALTPDGITGSMVLASVPAVGGLAGGRLIVEGVWLVNKALAVLLGVAVLSSFIALVVPGRRRTDDRRIAARRLAGTAAFVAAAIALAAYPAPLVQRLETTAARVVLRVSPEYAAEVADCLSRPPPPPAETGLPPGVVMAAPCVDESKK